MAALISMKRIRGWLVAALIGLILGIGIHVGFLKGRWVVNPPLRPVLAADADLLSETGINERLRVPAGFRISRFARGLAGARFLRFTTAGALLVSLPGEGQIVRLDPDRDGDGRSDGRQAVVTGLHLPHGLDLHEGWLYIAETDAFGRIGFDEETGTASGPFRRLVTGIPGGGHWTRTLRFGPDGWMYVSIGSSCNVCRETDPRRAAIVRYRPDGTGEEVFATGLRNSVGFAWRPGDGALFATDNGRDLLGDEFPPCELNRIIQGGFYGWPIANGNRVPDPDYGAGEETRIASSIPPVHPFRAHNAPLGITFLGGSPPLPPDYRNAALVALHGSWNRSRKDGYKVVSLHWLADGRIEERDFLTGFLRAEDESVIGRPVDVAQGPDGAIYVSDDFGDAVYRVAVDPGSAAPPAPEAPGPDLPAPTAPTAPARETPTFPTRPAGGDGPLPEPTGDGRRLWEALDCGRCHSADRSVPGMVPRPLDGLTRKYTAASLAGFLDAPRPPMPRFELEETDRLALARFLLATYP